MVKLAKARSWLMAFTNWAKRWTKTLAASRKRRLNTLYVVLTKMPVQYAHDRRRTRDSEIEDHKALPTNHNKAILTEWQVALVVRW